MVKVGLASQRSLDQVPVTGKIGRTDKQCDYPLLHIQYRLAHTGLHSAAVAQGAERVFVNCKVGCSIPNSPRPCAQVSLSKTLNPKFLLMGSLVSCVGV